MLWLRNMSIKLNWVRLATKVDITQKSSSSFQKWTNKSFLKEFVNLILKACNGSYSTITKDVSVGAGITPSTTLHSRLTSSTVIELRLSLK